MNFYERKQRHYIIDSQSQLDIQSNMCITFYNLKYEWKI